MALVVYGIKSCDTCRRARKFLEERNIEFRFHDLRENGLPGFIPEFDYTYDGVMRSLEHSHLRLGLDRIDIALVHDVDF